MRHDKQFCLAVSVWYQTILYHYHKQPPQTALPIYPLVLMAILQVNVNVNQKFLTWLE